MTVTDAAGNTTMVDAHLNPVTDRTLSPGLRDLFAAADPATGVLAANQPTFNQATTYPLYTNEVTETSSTTNTTATTTKRFARNKAGDAYIWFNRDYDHDPDFYNSQNSDDDWYAGTMPFTLYLADNEFVTSYELNLGPYAGDADATAETARLYDGDADGVVSDTADGTLAVTTSVAGAVQSADFAVVGRPYIYEQQANRAFGAYNGSDYANAAYGVADWKTNATSTATVSMRRAYDTTDQVTPTHQVYEQNYYYYYGYNNQYSTWAYHWKNRNAATDQANMYAYRVNYGYDTTLQTDNDGLWRTDEMAGKVPGTAVDNTAVVTGRVVTGFRVEARCRRAS